MLNILSKILNAVSGKAKGLAKNPLFYFGLVCTLLFYGLYASCDNSAGISRLINSRIVFFNSFFNESANPNAASLFSSKASAIPLETPDLKIMQDNTICGVSTPCVVSSRVLGDIFGGNNQNQKEVVDYLVQPGDTLQSIADAHKLSVNTLLWANSLTSSSTIKVGESLVVLPTDGVLHVVKSGDTISMIAQTYKAGADEIVSYNDLASQDDIYIGDLLIVPGGAMPKKAGPAINNQIPVADNFFIFPVEGRISQGLHYYNAVDVANKCGTPVFAAASGVVQRVRYGWNSGGGNYITILHSNGVVTYYGHFQTSFVTPGDKVYTGQNIASTGGAPGMAGAGRSTGCHLHFEVIGAKNPLSVYYKGSTISYK